MLQRGNEKLGPDIWTWSIPAKTACPAKSPVCSSVCYVARGRFSFPMVAKAMARNLQHAKSRNFVRDITEQIRRNRIQQLRIHVSGDLFSVAYIKRWMAIARGNPGTTFTLWTRSWNDPSLLRAVTEMAALRNVVMWFSCDRSMPEPPRVKRVRRAWLAINDEDQPAFPVDLVFRHKHKTIMKRMDGYLVCPYEQGIERQVAWSCSRCMLCYEHRKIARKGGSGRRRVPLLNLL